MKIQKPGLLFITRNLPPLRGGMERLNAQMAEALAADYRVTVLAPKGSRRNSSSLVTLHCCPFPGVAAFMIWAMLVGIVRSLVARPQCVVGGSGLVAPIVLVAGVLSRARYSVYLHGLDIVVDSKIYRAIWLPAIRRMHVCLVNSRNTWKLAHTAGVDEKRLRLVFPGVALPLPSDVNPVPGAEQDFRIAYNIGAGPILLSIGRLTYRKGLSAFIEHAMGPLLEMRPELRLVVIGDNAPDALNASGLGQRERIAHLVDLLKLSASVHLLGPVPEDVLRVALMAASVHVFPGIDVPGDVEGFGMVAIEAAAYGIPTVAFSVGGIPDAVGDPASGSLVHPGDYAGLVEQIGLWLDRSGDREYAVRCRAFAAGFSWPVFNNSLRHALDPEVKR